MNKTLTEMKSDSMLTNKMKKILVVASLFLCQLTFSTVVSAAVELDRIVAVVNDDVITQYQLNEEINMIKRQLRSQQQRMPDNADLTKQVLERMVLTRIQLQRAASRQIRIDDAALNNTLERMAAQNKMSLSELRGAMENDGIEYEDFRENLREQMTVAQLQRREVESGVTVTDQEIDNFIENRKIRGGSTDEYLLQHILVGVPEAATSEQIQAAKKTAKTILEKIQAGEDFSQLAIAKSVGQQALTGGDLGWRKYEQIPSLFSDIVAKMKVGDVSDIVRSPSGYHLIKLADKRSDTQKRIVRQTKVRHILVTPTDILANEQARNRIEQLKQRIDGGEDFATLAKVHSDDKASAINGGDLDWVSPGMMVKPFEDAMNKLKLNEVSGPVITQYGWHLIQVLGRRDHDDTITFERNSARELIRQQKIEPALENWRRRLRDEAFVQIKS